MVSQRLAGVPMEPNGIVCVPNEPVAGGLTTWITHQGPHSAHGAMAPALGLEPEKLRVVCPWVGGGFGPKAAVYVEYLIAGKAALDLQAPVKWTETRSEDMVSLVHGRDFVIDIALGVKNDGTIDDTKPVKSVRPASPDNARRDAELLSTGALDDPEAQTLYGDALWAKGLFDEADVQYRKALEESPQSSRAQFGLARSLTTRTRLDEALAGAQLTDRPPKVRRPELAPVAGEDPFEAPAVAKDTAESALLKSLTRATAQAIEEEDCAMCRAIGTHGAALVVGEKPWHAAGGPQAVQLVHQRHRIAAGADQVALGLDCRRTIDVADHGVIRMLGPEGRKGFGGTIVGQAAAGRQIRHQHDLAGIEDLGGLGHEMHTAEHDG